VVQGEVAEQGVDRREPVVAGGGTVAPVAFEVMRNAAISGASSSAMSRAAGVLPRRLEAKVSRSRKMSL